MIIDYISQYNWNNFSIFKSWLITNVFCQTQSNELTLFSPCNNQNQNYPHQNFVLQWQYEVGYSLALKVGTRIEVYFLVLNCPQFPPPPSPVFRRSPRLNRSWRPSLVVFHFSMETVHYKLQFNIITWVWVQDLENNKSQK